MSGTKRKNWNGKKVADGKQFKRSLGEVKIEDGRKHMDYWEADYGCVDCPGERRLLKKTVRRAIRLDGKSIVRKEMEEK